VGGGPDLIALCFGDYPKVELIFERVGAKYIDVLSVQVVHVDDITFNLHDHACANTFFVYKERPVQRFAVCLLLSNQADPVHIFGSGRCFYRLPCLSPFSAFVRWCLAIHKILPIPAIDNMLL